jgi:hypothetical protein
LTSQFCHFARDFKHASMQIAAGGHFEHWV